VKYSCGDIAKFLELSKVYFTKKSILGIKNENEVVLPFGPDEIDPQRVFFSGLRCERKRLGPVGGPSLSTAVLSGCYCVAG
jgi:hypothetical protein